MALVQQVTASSSSPATAMSTGPITTTTGNTVAIGISSSTTAPGVSDSKSNSWTASNHLNGTGVDGNVGNAWYGILATGGASHTFSTAFASDTPSMVVSEFSGRASSSVLDVQGGSAEGSDTASPHSAGSVTTTVVGDDIWAFNSDGSAFSQTWTAGSGWTTVAAGQNASTAFVQSMVQYRENQAVGTYTNNGSTGNSSSWSGYIFAFKSGAPTINVQPVSATVLQGRAATFSISATGVGTLHYQWKSNGVNVGTDSSSYTDSNATLADNGSVITCVVTDNNGSTTSDGTATLTVLPALNSLRAIIVRRIGA
jgi:hypothetical protein